MRKISSIPALQKDTTSLSVNSKQPFPCCDVGIGVWVEDAVRAPEAVQAHTTERDCTSTLSAFRAASLALHVPDDEEDEEPDSELLLRFMQLRDSTQTHCSSNTAIPMAFFVPVAAAAVAVESLLYFSPESLGVWYSIILTTTSKHADEYRALFAFFIAAISNSLLGVLSIHNRNK